MSRESMRLSEAEFRQLQENQKIAGATAIVTTTKRKPSHTPGVMNKHEARYAEMLSARATAGEIRGYEFEAWKFTLAHKLTYTPDFIVYREKPVRSQSIPLCGFRAIWWDQESDLVMVLDLNSIRAYRRGSVESVEVKACKKDGHVLMHEDAWIKLKLAADKGRGFPWLRWTLASYWCGAWTEKEIGAGNGKD